MYWNAVSEEYMPQIYIAMFAPTAGVSCEPSEYTIKMLLKRLDIVHNRRNLSTLTGAA